MPDAKKVFMGLPDQLTTGAILDAPLGTKVPANMKEVDALDEAFKSSGYVTSDGLKLATDKSTNNLTDWSGATVRKVLESFDGTISWAEMEMTYESMCHAFGAENVTKTPASVEAGEQLVVSIGADLPKPRAWVFKMKDGDARLVIVVPNGQVTEMDEITFNASDPVALPITLSCYPDGKGKSIYIFTDDGQKVGV